MPRAVIPERLARRQVVQLIAAERREIDGAVAAVDVKVDALDAKVPANLQTTLNDHNTRISNLESPPPP